MATRLTKQIASVAAGATVSLTVSKVGIAGATVNTGILIGYIGNEEVFRQPNGVTNTAGAPITQFDASPVNEPIGANESFDIQVYNNTGGALQYYVYIEIEDLE
jgi:hypothetical protein